MEQFIIYLTQLAPQDFNMKTHNQCIVGHAQKFLNSTHSDAHLILKQLHPPMHYDDAYKIYMPDSEYAWNATPQQAAKMLNHYVNTGEVNWNLL